MKRVTLALCMLLVAVTLVHASPFLVCDPQSSVTEYEVSGPTWVTPIVPAQADGSIKMDVAAANVGSNTLTIAACAKDTLWGRSCSATVNFTFTRPNLQPGVPQGEKLAP